MKLIITETIRDTYHNVQSITVEGAYRPNQRAMFMLLLSQSPYNSHLADSPDTLNSVYKELSTRGKAQWGWGDYTLTVED